MSLAKERAFGVASRYSNKAAVPAIAAGGTANEVIAIALYMDDWATGAEYAVGDTVLWSVDGRPQPVTCLTAHSTAVHPDWTPDSAPALWRPWHATSPEYALPYLMRHAEDRYMDGEYMTWNGGTWLCVADFAVWTPEERPEAWLAWTGEGVQTAAPDADDAGGDAPGYPAWAPWDGNNDNLYQIGDRVTHNGKAWESTAANNHWEPGVAMWIEVTE